jgi:hypothetical protein
MYAHGAVPRPREMNHTERRYSDYLREQIHAGEIQWALYEPIKIRLADLTWYTPDFLVKAKDGVVEIHEVKTTWRSGKAGWQEDARVKIKVAAEMIPIFRFKAVVLMPDQTWSYEEF